MAGMQEEEKTKAERRNEEKYEDKREKGREMKYKKG